MNEDNGSQLVLTIIATAGPLLGIIIGGVIAAIATNWRHQKELDRQDTKHERELQGQREKEELEHKRYMEREQFKEEQKKREENRALLKARVKAENNTIEQIVDAATKLHNIYMKNQERSEAKQILINDAQAREELGKFRGFARGLVEDSLWDLLSNFEDEPNEANYHQLIWECSFRKEKNTDTLENT